MLRGKGNRPTRAEAFGHLVGAVVYLILTAACLKFAWGWAAASFRWPAMPFSVAGAVVFFLVAVVERVGVKAE